MAEASSLGAPRRRKTERLARRRWQAGPSTDPVDARWLRVVAPRVPTQGDGSDQDASLGLSRQCDDWTLVPHSVRPDRILRGSLRTEQERTGCFGCAAIDRRALGRACGDPGPDRASSAGERGMNGRRAVIDPRDPGAPPVTLDRERHDLAAIRDMAKQISTQDFRENERRQPTRPVCIAAAAPNGAKTNSRRRAERSKNELAPSRRTEQERTRAVAQNGKNELARSRRTEQKRTAWRRASVAWVSEMAAVGSVSYNAAGVNQAPPLTARRAAGPAGVSILERPTDGSRACPR
jgi:hypothetical protein